MADYRLRVPDGDLRYRLDGDGETVVVLVHELGGSLESWDLVATSLARKHTVVRYDMRGFGQSFAVRGSLGIKDGADDLNQIIAEVCHHRKYALVGNAVGAAVVAQFLIDHPEEAGAGILISPALGVAAERRAVVLETADFLEKNGMSTFVDAELDKTYPVELRDLAQDRFQKYRSAFASNDPKSFAAYFRMLSELTIQENLHAIRAPVLVLSGTLDPNRPVAQGRAIAGQIKHADFAEIRSGHFMAYQTPELFLRAATPFLDQHLFS